MTEGEKYRALGYELVMRLGNDQERHEARQRREELNSWPKYRPGLVRPKQERAS